MINVVPDRLRGTIAGYAYPFGIAVLMSVSFKSSRLSRKTCDEHNFLPSARWWSTNECAWNHACLAEKGQLPAANYLPTQLPDRLPLRKYLPFSPLKSTRPFYIQSHLCLPTVPNHSSRKRLPNTLHSVNERLYQNYLATKNCHQSDYLVRNPGMRCYLIGDRNSTYLRNSKRVNRMTKKSSNGQIMCTRHTSKRLKSYLMHYLL